MDSKVKAIYPMVEHNQQDLGDVTEEDTIDCPKLILIKPYNGEEYSIVLKPRASITDLYNIISRIEIEKLNDESLSFTYHHATRRGKSIKLIVTMNTKALELVSIYTCKLHLFYLCDVICTQMCKEPKVKAIKPNYV